MLCATVLPFIMACSRSGPECFLWTSDLICCLDCTAMLGDPLVRTAQWSLITAKRIIYVMTSRLRTARISIPVIPVHLFPCGCKLNHTSSQLNIWITEYSLLERNTLSQKQEHSEEVGCECVLFLLCSFFRRNWLSGLPIVQLGSQAGGAWCQRYW